jgi:hypothetical protein
MMALPLLRVAVVEPTQNSRLRAGGKPQRSRKSPPANISLDHLNTAAFNYLLTHEIMSRQ